MSKIQISTKDVVGLFVSKLQSQYFPQVATVAHSDTRCRQENGIGTTVSSTVVKLIYLTICQLLANY